MACQMAATAVTLNDLEAHLQVEGLFKCSCRTFVQHFTRFQFSTDSVLAVPVS